MSRHCVVHCIALVLLYHACMHPSTSTMALSHHHTNNTLPFYDIHVPYIHPKCMHPSLQRCEDICQLVWPVCVVLCVTYTENTTKTDDAVGVTDVNSKDVKGSMKDSKVSVGAVEVTDGWWFTPVQVSISETNMID